MMWNVAIAFNAIKMDLCAKDEVLMVVVLRLDLLLGLMCRETLTLGKRFG